VELVSLFLSKSTREQKFENVKIQMKEKARVLKTFSGYNRVRGALR